MKTIKIIVILLIFSSNLLAQETLEEYLKYAAENNPSLKAKFSEYMSSMQRVAQVDALPEPQLAFGYFVSPVETRVGAQQFKLSLKQKFPWFGKLDARSDAVADKAKVKLKEFESLKYQLFFNIRKAWYDIYVRQKEISLVSKQIDFYKSLETLTDTKYKNGQASLADLMRIQIKINDLENRIKKIKNDILAYQVKFNTLLNRNESAEIVVLDNILLDKLELGPISIDSIFFNNSNINILLQKKTAAESSIESSKLEAYPDISVSLDYTSVNERTDISLPDNGKDIFMPMLSLNIPLFNKKYDAKVQEYQYQSEMIDYQLKDFKNKLRSDYERIRQNFSNSKRNIEFLNKQIQDSENILGILFTEYSNNSEKYLDLIIQKEKILIYEYKLELEKVQANLSVALLNMINSKM